LQIKRGEETRGDLENEGVRNTGLLRRDDANGNHPAEKAKRPSCSFLNIEGRRDRTLRPCTRGWGENPQLHECKEAHRPPRAGERSSPARWPGKKVGGHCKLKRNSQLMDPKINEGLRVQWAKGFIDQFFRKVRGSRGVRVDVVGTDRSRKRAEQLVGKSQVGGEFFKRNLTGAIINKRGGVLAPIKKNVGHH